MQAISILQRDQEVKLIGASLIEVGLSWIFVG